jgi:site-specific DNA-methyltransferase (adenine-specific)
MARREQTPNAGNGLSPLPSGPCCPLLDLRLADCMAVMRETPDNSYDLAIVDPPYGIGEHGKGNSRHKGGQEFTIFEPKHWDKEPPGAEYFAELRRVSKNQIIWGANYFSEHLPKSMGWIFWDKMIGGDFSDGELAFTSFQRALKKFTHSTFKNRATNWESAKDQRRIHPCQKPVPLYDWLLANYAKPGDRILDTHMGSGGIAIACHYRGHPLTACEVDADYYAAAVERIQRETRQLSLFTDNDQADPRRPDQ